MTDEMIKETVRLTQYSHGAGCGCKIAPSILQQILKTTTDFGSYPDLLVGNSERDDAAVFDIGDGTSIISTTDFFMPIVDDPFDFGRIASANAISDIYAMGGTPLMAISILGWPINKIGPEHAAAVIEGSRSTCQEAGIPLAGGHSIDSPEPIFGLAVTGKVATHSIKQNSKAKAGDHLFLTKALGVGMLSTAEKKGLLLESDLGLASNQMTRLNKIGVHLADQQGVHAMTDVTGFGLLGHLEEMCSESGVRAEVFENKLVLLSDLDYYIENQCIPGGTHRNWDSYGQQIGSISDRQKYIMCDPQTSGGLLVSVSDANQKDVIKLFEENDLSQHIESIGRIKEQSSNHSLIEIL